MTGIVDCTQSLSFLLVIEGLERARCTTARETRAVPLARPSLSITVDEKKRDCVQSTGIWAIIANCDSTNDGCQDSEVTANSTFPARFALPSSTLV